MQAYEVLQDEAQAQEQEEAKKETKRSTHGAGEQLSQLRAHVSELVVVLIP